MNVQTPGAAAPALADPGPDRLRLLQAMERKAHMLIQKLARS